MRRRRYAELEPAPEAEVSESPAPDAEADAQPESRAAFADSPHGRVIALQKGAGNAATGRLLRMRADEAGVAREPQESAAPAAAAPGKLDEDPAADTAAESRKERTILEGEVVPGVLDRLVVPELKGTRESLSDIALLARGVLAQRMRESSDGGAVQLHSTATDVQNAVMKVARLRGIIVPGHRPFGDPAGLDIEAKALGDLIGKDMQDLGKVETSADGITFAIGGELKASRPAGGAAPGGVPGRDSGRIEIKVDARPVELKGEVVAKAGRPTTWSGKIEIEIVNGTDALPDAASIARLVRSAGNDIAQAAQALDIAMSGQRNVDKGAVEQSLKPSKDGLEEVVGYMEQHTADMEARPHAPPVPGAKDSDGGSVSAQITITITF